MKVVFTKTGHRRYKVTIERTGKDAVSMDPAPGYHERLPHDAAHFIVEDELRILGGVFGQLAGGGTANTFLSDDQRKIKKFRKQGKILAKENKKGALFSEHAIFAAQSRWEKHLKVPDTRIIESDLRTIIDRFEAFAREWSKLLVGESLFFDWNENNKPKRRREPYVQFGHASTK